MLIFFYGLFMDLDALLKKGIQATNPRKAYLIDYTIKIGSRASLIPCKNEVAYGIAMELSTEDVAILYSEKSVSDYAPKKVTVLTESNQSLEATCYILPPELLSGTNEIYARSLYDLALKLDFPMKYLKKIKGQER